METEIARQIRAGIIYAHIWATAAKTQTVQTPDLEAMVDSWKRGTGRLGRKAFERTIRRYGITELDGMYWWLIEEGFKA